MISDDDDADFDIGKKKAAKKAKKAGKPQKKTPAVLDSDDEMEKNSASTPDSGSESEKSDVLATRALIEKLTPTKKKKAKVGSLSFFNNFTLIYFHCFPHSVAHRSWIETSGIM